MYIFEETEDSYILRYYDDKGSSEDLWQNEKKNVVTTKTLEVKYYGTDEIAFTIEYEEGMTWQEWIFSSYNTMEMYEQGTYVRYNKENEEISYWLWESTGHRANPRDLIAETGEYYLKNDPQ